RVFPVLRESVAKSLTCSNPRRFAKHALARALPVWGCYTIVVACCPGVSHGDFIRDFVRYVRSPRIDWEALCNVCITAALTATPRKLGGVAYGGCFHAIVRNENARLIPVLAANARIVYMRQKTLALSSFSTYFAELYRLNPRAVNTAHNRRLLSMCS